MKTLSRAFFISLCTITSAIFAAPADERATVLTELRTALAQRDFDAAKTALAAAKKLAGEPEFDKELDRMELLHEYTHEFWKAVDAGGKSLQATEELVIGDQRAAVVEYENFRLVIRVAGQNRQYALRDLPNNLTRLLAERSFKPNVPQNKVFLGAYHAMDAKGDRAEARRLWLEAQKGGVDVAGLLPELSVTNKLQAAAELPKLSALAREALLPKHWYARKTAGDKPQREAVGKLAATTAEGRLSLAIPDAETAPVQVFFERGLMANFVCRAVLVDVPKGVTLGMFSANAAEHSQTVFLPEGTCQVEFTRTAHKFKCTIDKAPTDVHAAANTPARLAGYVGLELPPGSSCTVAYWEVVGR